MTRLQFFLSFFLDPVSRDASRPSRTGEAWPKYWWFLQPSLHRRKYLNPGFKASKKDQNIFIWCNFNDVACHSSDCEKLDWNFEFQWRAIQEKEDIKEPRWDTACIFIWEPFFSGLLCVHRIYVFGSEIWRFSKVKNGLKLGRSILRPWTHYQRKMRLRNTLY